jgi:DNA-directed RNA polymerase specialized sigma subunit
VYCGALDGEEHLMQADTSPANSKRSRWDYYICSVKKSSRDKRCTARRVGAQALNEAVVEKLTSEVLTRENLRPIADELARALGERNRDAVARMTALRGRLNEIRAAIDKLMDALEKSDFSPSIQRRLAEREDEERQLISEIATLEAMRVKPADIPRVTDRQLDDFIASMKATLMGEDVELAKQAIRRFVAKIVVNEKAGTIYYTFPLQDLSRKGVMPPQGFGPGAVFLAETAMQRFVVALYYDTTVPEYPWPSNVPLTDRNQAIVDAYQRGETLERIAAAFAISNARVHQILKQRG